MKTKVAYFGVYMALALIFSYVESLVPISLGIPGVKLGLANLIVIITLYKMGIREAYVISIVRVILAGFIFGNMFGIIYSLAGGLLSLTVMIFLKRTDWFSIIGISMAGGIFHNIGQLILAGIIVESTSVIYYLPALLLAGLITGCIIGVISKEMIKRLKKL